MKRKEIKVKDLEKGIRYEFEGNMKNGIMNGKPYISKEHICRKIRYVTDTEIRLECDRVFIIDKDLHIYEI